MSIAKEIIHGLDPDYAAYLREEGSSLDDIDEYGFTPMIESVIARRISVTEELLKRGVDVNKSDVLGRTPLHWAVDQGTSELTRLLLSHGANPNAYDLNGLSVLVYPILRGQNDIKHLLYQYGAKLDFALDFIYAKLLGHRFELLGDADIVNPQGEFIELDYEGFILEFTVAVVKDALRRFTSSYSTRHLRRHFPYVHAILDGFMVADELLKYQHIPLMLDKHWQEVSALIQAPLLILPAASRGHALCFIRMGNYWAKIDRGENSLKEGSANIYQITKPEAFNIQFVKEFLYKRQPRKYFHQVVHDKLGLKPLYKLPITSQIAGNCSWANVQALIPVGYALQQLQIDGSFSADDVMVFFQEWSDWDQDRALDECVQRFYLADSVRRASLAGILAAILFQSCDADNPLHLKRAEKILPILTIPDYAYIMQSYLTHYCEKRLTPRGNNLLKLLDDCGVNSNVDVTPIATGLKKRRR